MATTTRRPAPSAPAAKADPKATAKVASKVPAKTVKMVKKPAAPAAVPAPVPVAIPQKDTNPKLVRDSFTIPKNEYEAIDSLKARALSLGLGIKKSELLRAGLMQLAFMPDAAFAKALAAVPTLKTGRPAADTPSDKRAK